MPFVSKFYDLNLIELAARSILGYDFPTIDNVLVALLAAWIGTEMIGFPHLGAWFWALGLVAQWLLSVAGLGTARPALGPTQKFTADGGAVCAAARRLARCNRLPGSGRKTWCTSSAASGRFSCSWRRAIPRAADSPSHIGFTAW